MRVGPFAVGVKARGGVTVENEVHASIRQHGVGCAVKGKERCSLLRHAEYVALKEHPTLGRDLIRNPEIQILESQSKGTATQETAHLDATSTGVVRGHGRSGLRLVVKFLLLAVGHYPARVVDTEVDPGSRKERCAVRRRRRHVLDRKGRVAGRRVKSVGRRDHHAVTVGVFEVLVDPTASRKVVLVELAGAHKHRRHFAVEDVAVDSERREGVVRLDGLAALHRLEGNVWRRVPEANVIERGGAGLQISRSD